MRNCHTERETCSLLAWIIQRRRLRRQRAGRRSSTGRLRRRKGTGRCRYRNGLARIIQRRRLRRQRAGRRSSTGRLRRRLIQRRRLRRQMLLRSELIIVIDLLFNIIRDDGGTGGRLITLSFLKNASSSGLLRRQATEHRHWHCCPYLADGLHVHNWAPKLLKEVKYLPSYLASCETFGFKSCERGLK